jgi:hypothetical protein
LSHNRAVGGNGNANGSEKVPAGLAAGGAIFNALFGVLEVRKSVLEHNLALGGQGTDA